jgi:extracellular matrix regulatory protein A
VGRGFVNVGFGTVVATGRLLAIVSPDSEPLRRLIAAARQEGKLIDATHGRRTKALLIFDTGHLLAAALHPETLLLRLGGQGDQCARAAGKETEG